MSAIKQITESANVLPTFNDTVDAILAREFKYCKPVPKEMANGEYVGVLTFNTDWLKNVDERIAVQYALNQRLWSEGKHREDRPMMFSPIVVPFHVNESGEPTSQLRIFFYRPKPAEGQRISQSTIICRAEPYGTTVKFDAESQYAQASSEPAVATEETVAA